MRTRLLPIGRRHRIGMFPGIPLVGSPDPEPGPEADAIYVSKSGSNTTGDGTITKPYRSLAKAATMAVAGDTIYIRGGYYDVIGTDVRLGSGTAYKEYKMVGTQAKPITVRSYPGEWAVFDGLNDSWWPRFLDDGNAEAGAELLWITGQWVNWEHLEFRNGPGNGVRAIALDCKFRHLVFQNCHATGWQVGGSRNEIAYCLSQDNYSISNGGNSGNGFMLLTTITQVNQAHRFPNETIGTDNHVHHNAARNVSDDGFNNIHDMYDSVYEHNVSYEHGYGSSGNGEGFKMGFKDTYNRGDVFRFNLAWDCKIGMSTNYSTGILTHNNTVFDARTMSYAFWASAQAGSGDNTAYNNLSLRLAGGTHRAREAGVTVHTHNAGYTGAWDPLGGEGNFDTHDVDPMVVSYNPASLDFLRLGPTSPYLSNGKVITGGSTTLGAIPDGQDFAGGWDWRALAAKYPSHGLKVRDFMYPIAQT